MQKKTTILNAVTFLRHTARNDCLKREEERKKAEKRIYSEANQQF